MKTSLFTFYMTFFRIGLFTFGGGYAMLPMLIKEVVEKQEWASEEELLDYFAISQSTPGIIAVNTATFIGMKFRGLKGAAAATIGVVTPCWVVISIIAGFLNLVKDNIYVEQAFAGIRIVVLALIIHSVIKMYKKAVKGYKDIMIMVVGSVLISFDILQPVTVILLSGLLGLIILLFKEVTKHDVA